jgi:hypothetical protein
MAAPFFTRAHGHNLQSESPDTRKPAIELTEFKTPEAHPINAGVTVTITRNDSTDGEEAFLG